MVEWSALGRYVLLLAMAITGMLLYRNIGVMQHLSTMTRIGGILFILLAAVSIAKNGYLFNPLRKIPRVKGFSSSSWLATLLKEPKGPEVLQYNQQLPDEGLIRYVGMFGAERLLVSDPKALHEVLYEKSYTFHKSDIAKRIVGPLLGGGVLVAEGDLHKIQKKKLGPAFAPRHIKELYPTLWRKTTELITALSAEEDHEIRANNDAEHAINFSIWAARATLDIISVAAFGGDFDTIQNPNSELSNAYGRLFAPNSKRDLRSTLAIFLPLKILQVLPLRRNKLIAESNSIIRAFCLRSIHDAKAQIAAPTGSSKPDVNILSVALRSQELFDDHDLVDQLMTFLVAGHETTANTLAWAIFYLCKHPSKQHRLRQEIRQHLPSPQNTDIELRAEQLDDLPFLQAVCNEILRLMPVIPMVYRQAAEPTTLLEHAIPAGTMVVISPWAANRSKREWGEDAEEFRPERWMEEDGAKGSAAGKGGGSLSSGNLMTFVHGPRACIGQGFARAELAVLLAGIVGSFEVRLPVGGEAVEEKFGFITVKPAGGLNVCVRRLAGW